MESHGREWNIGVQVLSVWKVRAVVGSCARRCHGGRPHRRPWLHFSRSDCSGLPLVLSDKLATMDTPDHDPVLYYEDVVLDYSTPRLDSRGASPGGPSQQQNHGCGLPLLQLSDWNENLTDDEVPHAYIHYSIEWKLLLNKGGRLTKLMLNPEREQDLILAPGAYWYKILKQEVETRLKQKTPKKKRYEPEETNIVVSVTDRHEHKLSKHYPKFDINWNPTEKQLRTWSPLFRGGRKLQIDIAFICKDTSQLAAMKTRSSTRRGATGRQHAELDEEDEADEAAGRVSHHRAVYALMRCTGPPCTGSLCWRDPDRNRHFPLDGEVMQELVNYSEDGNKLEDQKDLPPFIRDLIYKKDMEEAQRKEDKRKRRSSFSGSYPIQITNVLPGSSNRASSSTPPRLNAGDADVASGIHKHAEWSIPEPRDDAIKRYCIWHCARVSSDVWKASLQKAATITFRQGLDLKDMYEDQDLDLFVKDAKAGILHGIARSWVRDVKKWVDELEKNIVS